MAAGPTLDQVYRAKRKLCIRVEQEAKEAGYKVMRIGAKTVHVFYDGIDGVEFGGLIGSISPKVLRASNGEACIMLETDAKELQKFIS